MRFTVFTPTYNRAHTLPRLYESLCGQTFRDFEWVVVDDGSTDETAEFMHDLRSHHKGFPITYLWTSNGGKHRTINQGVKVAAGELFFIVDSDDYLPSNSLQIVDTVERSIPVERRTDFAGVCGLRAFPDGQPIGTTFDGDLLNITTLERGAYGISGDKAEVIYTAAMRAFPFPEFPGEKFLTEAVVWDRIARAGLKLRFFNQVVYTCEYLPGGLTDNYRRLLHENPRGHGLYLSQRGSPGGTSARLTIGRYLLYHDAHIDKLSLAEISRNLGLSPSRLRWYLALRTVGRRARGTVVHLRNGNQE